MLVPWRFIRTWTCFACGKCCKKYVVPLSNEEAERLMRKYGKFVVEKIGRRYFIRKVNGRCIFLKNGLCTIQEEKPRACQLWPFYIYKKPRKSKDAKYAYIEYKNEDFYVYVDTFCRGINRGITSIKLAVLEALRIYLGEETRQQYTTSPFPENYKFSTPIPYISKANFRTIVVRELI